MLLSTLLGSACTAQRCQEDAATSVRSAVKPGGEVVVVQLSTPGLNPADVEALVTEPLEARLAEVESVVEIQSLSREGRAVIALRVAAGVSPTVVRDAINASVQRARQALPEELAQPTIAVVPSKQGEIRFELAGGDMVALSEVLETKIRPSLLQLPHVSQVSGCGVRRLGLHIHLDTARLRAYGLALEKVAAALIAAGSRPSEGESVAPSKPRISNPDQLGQTVVAELRGVPVRLRDLGRIELAVTEPDCICPGEGIVCGSVALDDHRAAAAVRRTLQSLADPLPFSVSVDETSPAVPLRTVFLCGQDSDALEMPAQRLADLVRDAGHSPVLSGLANQPELRFRADPEQLARFGLTPQAVARVVRAARVGLPVMEIQDGARTLPVTLVLGDRTADTPEQLGAIAIQTQSGDAIPLRSLVRLETARAPEALLRRNGRPCVAVTFPDASDLPPHLASPAKRLELAPGQTVESLPDGLLVGP